MKVCTTFMIKRIWSSLGHHEHRNVGNAAIPGHRHNWQSGLGLRQVSAELVRLNQSAVRTCHRVLVRLPAWLSYKRTLARNRTQELKNWSSSPRPLQHLTCHSFLALCGIATQGNAHHGRTIASGSQAQPGNPEAFASWAMRAFSEKKHSPRATRTNELATSA